MFDVAITGIGIVSTIGTGIEKVAESLRNGKSGVHLDPLRRKLGFRSALTGYIDDYTPPKISKKKQKTFTDFGLMAYSATLEAIEKAGWTDEQIQNDRTGLIIGNDSSTLANYRQVEITKNEKGTATIGSGTVIQSINSTVSMNLSTVLGTLGASWTISSACSSGSHAIGQGFDLIALGRQDRMICGGTQELNWEGVASFDATNAFSMRQDEPEKACRPFDVNRDGLVPSGGAAIVLLERYDLARKRGATIYGRILSYTFSSDGGHLTIPTGDGLQRCMIECLERAKISPQKIDYINAHATSTPRGDEAESRAIAKIFKNETPWVSSNKSMTGHEMWMSGAAQVVYTVIMGRDKFIAPNINFQKQSPNDSPIRIASETIDQKPGIALCNSAGFGGTNSCLLIGCDI